MYKSIYVALDNSEHSDAGTTVALELAEAFSSRCTGMHVYAARMHDYRFKQMEYTLPDEYQDEAELLRQRRIDDFADHHGVAADQRKLHRCDAISLSRARDRIRGARSRRTQLGRAGRRHRGGPSRPCRHGRAGNGGG